MKVKGFTLIELMVVVAIVAILAAFAMPAYQNHVLRSSRTVAMADMEAIAAAMARYRSQNFTYAGAVLGTGTGAVFPRAYSPDGPAAKAAYTLTLTAAGNTFTIEAVPKGRQLKDSCGKLGLDQVGVRKAVGSNCW